MSIDIEMQRKRFEAALLATDPGRLLPPPDFSRHVVASGYAGYISTSTECAFFGWMLAMKEGGQ